MRRLTHIIIWITNQAMLNHRVQLTQRRMTNESQIKTGLKVNDQLVASATRISAVRLKNHVWLHHHILKAKEQCDFSSAYSPDHINAD